MSSEHLSSQGMGAPSVVLEYPRSEVAALSMLQSIKRAVGATTGYVALRPGEGERDDVLVVDGGGLRLALRRDLRADVYRTARPVRRDGRAHADAPTEAGPPPPNALLAPLLSAGEVVGVIGLGDKPGGFSDEDVRTVSALGRSPDVLVGA
jgi:hypothetical protein